MEFPNNIPNRITPIQLRQTPMPFMAGSLPLPSPENNKGSKKNYCGYWRRFEYDIAISASA